MTKKKALLESIKKWEKICFKGGKDNGSGNCMLCREYDKYKCKPCPVHMVTSDACDSTPFMDWCWHSSNGETVKNDEDFELALQEYFFLCMLYHEYYGDE